MGITTLLYETHSEFSDFRSAHLNYDDRGIIDFEFNKFADKLIELLAYENPEEENDNLPACHRKRIIETLFDSDDNYNTLKDDNIAFRAALYRRIVVDFGQPDRDTFLATLTAAKNELLSLKTRARGIVLSEHQVALTYSTEGLFFDKARSLSSSDESSGSPMELRRRDPGDCCAFLPDFRFEKS